MSGLLRYLLASGLGLALFYGLYCLGLRRETYFRVNRIFLVAGLLVSFLAPIVPLTSPFFTAPAPTPSADLKTTASLPSHGQAPEAALSNAQPPASRVSPGTLVFAIYLLGALAFLARRVSVLLRFARVARSGTRRRVDGLKVVSLEADVAPFSFLTTVFLGRNAGDESEKRGILAHEAVHVRQLHSLDIVLMELAAIAQWFNPFVWPYRRSLQETHEYLADAGVIAQGFGPASYQRLLFERHVGAKLFEFVHSFGQSQIKRRILMLSRPKSKGPARLKPLLALPLAALLALLFAQPKAAALYGQEKGGGERAVVEKKKAEELRLREADILKKFAAAESLAQKRKLLSRLEEILQAEEGSTDIAEGGWKERAGSETIAIRPGEKWKQDDREARITPDDREARTFTLDDPMARIALLQKMAEKLESALEKPLDPAQKTDLEKKLTEVKLQLDIAMKAAAQSQVTFRLDEAKFETDLLTRIEILTRIAEEMRTVLKTDLKPDRRAELEKSLQSILKEEAEIRARQDKLKKDMLEKIR